MARSDPHLERSAPHLHVPARRVLLAAGITVAAALLELSGARFAGSLFLVADAVHLLAHLAIFAVLLLPPHAAHERREDLATCAILVIILAIAAGIGLESTRGLLEAAPAPRPAMLLLSLLGLSANLASAFFFRDPSRTHWSFRAALAHELSDASLTLIALVGAAAIALSGARWVDSRALSLSHSGSRPGRAGSCCAARARGEPPGGCDAALRRRTAGLWRACGSDATVVV